MYIILDGRLRRIGILSNGRGGTTPFYNDMISKQIADDNSTMDIGSVKDTLSNSDPNANSKNWGHVLESIYVPYGYPDTHHITQGNHLAYQDPDNQRWYVMRINSVTDAIDQSGSHYKQASGINLCIWKLGKTVHSAKEIKNANSKVAFRNLLSSTGWYMDPNSEVVGGSQDISFDGSSSNQNYLQQFCQAYGAEIDAFVEFDQGWKIALKKIEVKRRIGEDTGKRVKYKTDLTDIKRTVVDDSLYTKLYVYGADGSSCAYPGNGNKAFVKDDVANKIYNPSLGDYSTTYLEGTISSSSIKNPVALYNWGMKQLKIFNHPRANYTVSVNQNYNANLGDTIRVLDLDMQPELTVQSRVIKKQRSFSDPSQTQIILGEFTTVNVVAPSFVRSMNNRITNHMTDLLNQIKNDPSALNCVIDKPDGLSWEEGQFQKRFTAHVSVLGEDISTLIQPKGYVWELYRDGELDESFTQQHEMNGQNLTIGPEIVGEIRLSIDTSYIANVAEIGFNEDKIQHVFTINVLNDSWGDPRDRALQYVNYNKSDGYYYAAYVYTGRHRPKTSSGSVSQPEGHTIFSRITESGTLVDSMVLIFSRHNSNFGLQNINGTPYIWTTYYDSKYNSQNNARRYWVARIPYQPGKVIQPSDSSYQNIKPYSDSMVMANYDNSSDKVIVSYDSSPEMKVEIYNTTDLLNDSTTQPEHVLNRLDYGFYPKTTDDDKYTSKQTFQSGALYYPYYLFTTGDVNMSDQRYVYGVNIKTETLIFKKDLTFDNFNLGNYSFAEPETLSLTTDNDGYPQFLFGLNYKNSNYSNNVSGIWKIGFDIREDRTISTQDLDIEEDRGDEE